MTMHWPQLAWLALALMSVGGALYKHGEPETGRHHFGWSLVGAAINAAILYAGGFFG